MDRSFLLCTISRVVLDSTVSLCISLRTGRRRAKSTKLTWLSMTTATPGGHLLFYYRYSRTCARVWGIVRKNQHGNEKQPNTCHLKSQPMDLNHIIHTTPWASSLQYSDCLTWWNDVFKLLLVCFPTKEIIELLFWVNFSNMYVSGWNRKVANHVIDSISMW